ncbi:amidase [Sphaerisporangium sp. B11E5]|uniref:amidase n=1 Tax=Sphaerisporangium sp. B11E5 TaxID=3153563 RepID=UPI00325E078C
MELHEYAEHDALGLAELMASGAVSAKEVETVAREALAEADAAVNGLAAPLFDEPLWHADGGPFAGVPFLIKDHGPVAAGVPFGIGSRALRGAVAQRDTELMSRFRMAGLSTLGVTTVPEMAVSFATESVRHGLTRNPWDLTRGVGGSSGGAAALVAAGAVPVAHGGDGAGSIRVPAACCGLVGLKPSRARVPCGPDAGEAVLGMSYEFALTRTVRDAAHLLDAVHGPATGDKYTAPPPRGPYARELGREPGPLRVAVTTAAWSGVPVDPEVAAAAAHTGRVLERAGHHVTEASPDVAWDAVTRSMVAGLAHIGSLFLLAPRQPDPAEMEAVSRRVLEFARGYGVVDMTAAAGAQNEVTRAVGAFFTGYDLLVTPVLARSPAPHGTLNYDDPGHTVTSWVEALCAYAPFTAVFNISGQPAVSLPLGHGADGLPIGVQIVAPYGREDLLFQVAAWLERAMPWRDRIPPVHVGGH